MDLGEYRRLKGDGAKEEENLSKKNYEFQTN